MNGWRIFPAGPSVPQSDPAAADCVLIECPACGASESADPAMLADAPTIVCRNCGHTWPSAPKRRRRSLALVDAPAGRELIDAERRPLVTFSDGAEKAWALKVEGDILPEQPPEPRRAPLIAAAVAAALFLAAFVAGREAAVASAPDLAGLYAAIGLPVNLDGLAIEAVEVRESSADQPHSLAIRGVVRNTTGVARTVPPLLAYFPSVGEAGDVVRFSLPTAALGGGEQAAFEIEIDGAPEAAEEIVLRFLRPSETMANR
jgi:hypothetical protein